ncbi:MFS general substrate transporter [Mycena sanguinolenta]|uniref:MFS general substrate transporter n=1 Tax=Mycena sanguinolenta TaxID=230812 RepID=A0A8H6XUS8_9AGAR|nr:MFS general substrate transporter [Mycena sanguinolenta]
MATLELPNISSMSQSIAETNDSKIEQLEAEPPAPGAETLVFEEGTLRGWLTVLGGSLVAMPTFGNNQVRSILARVVYQDFYTRTFFPNETPSTISWIGSVQVSLAFLIGVLAGKLFDKGYFRILLVSGSLLLLFSSFMLSLVKPGHFYQALLSQGFGMGIGSGLIFVPSISVLSHYFRRRRAVVMGIVLSTGSLGSIIYAIIFNKLIKHENLGFPWAVRIIAFINVFVLAISNLIMKPRPPARKPEPVDLTQILRDGPYWLTNLGMFLGFLGVFVPYFYLQLFSFSRGINAEFLTWTIPILNAGAMPGRVLPNFLADRYGTLNVLLPAAFLSGTIMWALLGITNDAGVVVFALFYGFVSGAFLTLVSPTIAAFSTSPTMNDIGLRIGISYSVIGLALLGGTPIAGALLTSSYIWWRPLLYGCDKTNP